MSCCQTQSNKWMNARAKAGEIYTPTKYEHMANIITHGVAIIPSTIAVWYMISYARLHTSKFNSTLIYGTGLVLMFSVSTLFHVFSSIQTLRNTFWRAFFLYCDKASIYIFIASSYTPWLYIRETNSAIGEYMLNVVWGGAILGVIYLTVFHEKYKLLEIIFFLTIGICPAIFVLDSIAASGLFELALGGIFYVTGIAFFKSDGIVPFAHAIWHVFVFIAACIHYYAIFVHLILVDHGQK